MTLPEVYELMTYWEQQPPTHLLFAAWVGFKPGRDKRTPSESELRSVAAMFKRS